MLSTVHTRFGRWRSGSASAPASWRRARSASSPKRTTRAKGFPPRRIPGPRPLRSTTSANQRGQRRGEKAMACAREAPPPPPPTPPARLAISHRAATPPPAVFGAGAPQKKKCLKEGQVRAAPASRKRRTSRRAWSSSTARVGTPVDIGGYRLFGGRKVAAAMRPSPTFNQAFGGFEGKSPLPRRGQRQGTGKPPSPHTGFVPHGTVHTPPGNPAAPHPRITAIASPRPLRES